MKPFDLEAAKAGAPVQTRDGRKVRIICFDRKKTDYPIVALLDNGDQEELCMFSKWGTCFGPDRNNLIMTPIKKQGWVALFRTTTGHIYSSQEVYPTKEAAQMSYSPKTNKVGAAQIEWEE